MRAEIYFIKDTEKYGFRKFVVIWMKEATWYKEQGENDSECSLYLEPRENTRIHISDFEPFSDDIKDILNMANKYVDKFMQKSGTDKFIKEYMK